MNTPKRKIKNNPMINKKYWKGKIEITSYVNGSPFKVGDIVNAELGLYGDYDNYMIFTNGDPQIAGFLVNKAHCKVIENKEK
jgi:hypothetical protein